MPIDFDNLTLTIIGVVAHLFLIVAFLVRERHRPTATVAWLTILVFAPLIGLVAYWLFGAQRVRKVSRRVQRAHQRLRSMLEQHDYWRHIEAACDTDHRDARTVALVRLGGRLSSTPATSGNRVTMLVDAAATYREIIHAIEGAQHHVHLLFYIFQPDSVGVQLRDRLAKRAGEGLKVRVLVDAVGSFALSSRFWEPLVEAGAEVAEFRPVRFTPLRPRDRNDLRNHRKIVVVDGRVGFTGGINIGREYLGLNPEIGHWRDTHVRLEGPAALALQTTFAEDWLAAAGHLLDAPEYFPPPVVAPDGCIVQIIDSGPDQRWPSIARLYVQAVAMAESRVWISSPYFAPDPTMEDTLISAALRGVDVRILLPKKPDHLLVGLASKSFYADLLDAGVKIFEYGRGFLHAKTMVVDHWVGTIGSANLDMRSFELNFELNAFAFSPELAETLERQFVEDMRHAFEVTFESEERVGLPARFGRSVARLLAPLL